MQKITSAPVLLMIALLLSMSVTVHAQNSEKVSPKNAISLIEAGNWEKAKQMYLELLKQNPDNQEYNLYCGVAYLNSRINAEKSLDYFKKVDSDQIPGVLLLMAEAYHYTGDFDSAKKYYEAYRDTDGVKVEKGLAAEMDMRIKQCETGKTMMGQPTDGKFVENLGENVNSMFLDYAPVIFKDLNTLVFTGATLNTFEIEYMTHQEKGQEEIYFSSYNHAMRKWGEKTKADGSILNKNVNSDINESSITFSSDLARFYFYRNGGLYVSENMGDPKLMDIKLDGFSESDIIAIEINAAEDHLFITSDKKGGMGGSDIYMSYKSSDGSWTEFTALEGVNTDQDESSPFLSANGKTFYFASKGHNSIGDFDVFKATFSNETASNITNMGVPVNSTANDIHFKLTDDSEEFGYLASDRMGGSGDYDVWRFWTCYDIQNTQINGKFMAKGGPIQNVTLTLMTVDSAVVSSSSPLSNGGNYSFKVNTETDYILRLDIEGYAQQDYAISIPEQCSEYNIFQTLTAELKADNDAFVFEQTSTLNNGFFNIDMARGEDSREAYLAGLTSESPDYSEPETKVTTFEKDQMLADLGAEPVKNADGKDVYELGFEFASSELTEDGKKMVANLAKGLKSNPNKKVVIAGHTDSQGPAGYNKRLSVKRAQAVADILLANGVKSDQITVEGYGESQLKVKDTTDDGGFVIRWGKQNRRVEIEIQ